MLVPIINTTDRSGGAGIAAFRQSQALEAMGVVAPVLCLHRRFGDERSFRYRPRNSEQSPSLQAQRNALQSIQQRFINENRSSASKTIFSSPWAGGLLVADNPVIQAARVIHLHWVNHFLDLHSIEELLATGRPIVWTMHDEWLFTAGCHYTTGCERFLTHCNECPQLLHDPYGLVLHWFEQKRDLLASANLTVVTPSEWLAERARRSTILGGKRIEVIRNTFDTEIFAPRPEAARRTERQRHGFSDDSVVIGFGAQTLRDVRKGFGLLVSALKSLQSVSNLCVLVFGSRSEELDALSAHVRIAYVGELHETSAIADILNACDCFVVPSLEENYPNVIVEALLCGTPVIAYACGGIPEQVRDNESGLLVSPVGSVEALRTALAAFSTDAALRAKLRQFDRSAVAACHHPLNIGRQLTTLYRSLVPDFDAPVDELVHSYLCTVGERRGAARDFLAVPSYRSAGDSLIVNRLVADHVERHHLEVLRAARASEEQKYLGFFDVLHSAKRGGRGVRFLNFGWSPSEEGGTWSSERSAGIAAWWPTGGRVVTLRIGALCRGISQVAILRIGQEEVGRIKLSATRSVQEVRIMVPASAAAGGIVQLRIDFPHAQPEKGTSRLLGMYVDEISASIETDSAASSHRHAP